MATLFALRLAERIGWANTFGLAMMPVLGVAILFAVLAKDSPASAAHLAGKRAETVGDILLSERRFGSR
jgi:hypothetical protein